MDFILPSPEERPSLLCATLCTEVGLLRGDSSEARVSQSPDFGGRVEGPAPLEEASAFSGCDNEAASMEFFSTAEVGEEGDDPGCASSSTGIGWSRSKLGKKSSRWLIS